MLRLFTLLLFANTVIGLTGCAVPVAEPYQGAPTTPPAVYFEPWVEPIAPGVVVVGPYEHHRWHHRH